MVRSERSGLRAKMSQKYKREFHGRMAAKRCFGLDTRCSSESVAASIDLVAAHQLEQLVR